MRLAKVAGWTGKGSTDEAKSSPAQLRVGLADEPDRSGSMTARLVLVTLAMAVL
jgi:hypothetical protein